jgi:hypothetical protein
MTYKAAQFPELSNSEVTMYTSAAPGNAAVPSIFQGTFQGLNKSAAQFITVIQPLSEHLNTSYGPDIRAQVTNIEEKPSYYDWWRSQQDTTGATTIGLVLAVASRLVEEKALNQPNFTSIIKKAGSAGIAFNVVVGPCTHAYPTDFSAAGPA